MKSNLKKLLFLVLFFVLAIITCFLCIIDEIPIALFTGLFAFFSLILLVKESSSTRSPEVIFLSEVNNILRTYDTILVEIDSIPNLKEKIITKTKSFKDMVNLEYEFRKPIYYVHNDESYDFILINKDDSYTYTLKKDEEKNSLLEAYLDSLSSTETSTGDLDIIDSLDKTTVIRVDKDKEYLVSPVRDKKEESSNELEEKSLDLENKEELDKKVDENKSEDKKEESSNELEEKSLDLENKEELDKKVDENKSEDKKEESSNELEEKSLDLENKDVE